MTNPKMRIVRPVPGGGDDYTHVIIWDKVAGEAISVPKEDLHLYE